MAERTRAIGVNHIALEVGDVDEALELYGRIFAFDLRGRAGRMAFVDLGDQFIALAPGVSDPPTRHRHIGLVVEDVQAALDAARDAGLELRGTTFIDPWGNQFQVVAYSDVQFTKAPEVLAGMGLDALEKSDSALAELRAKGLHS